LLIATVFIVVWDYVVGVHFLVGKLDSLSAFMHKAGSVTVLAFLKIHI
jgi:hypothetical protein